MLRSASVVLVILLVGCGEDKPSKNPGPTNNSAVLSGPAVGTNAAPAANLRRIIPVSATGGGFEVGSGYVTRPEPADANVYLAVPVKNTTSGLRCAIGATSLVWQGTDSVATSSLQGSVGQNSSGFGNRCLQPGETGYLVDIAPTPSVFDSATGVTLSLSAEDQGWTTPEAAIVPTSYSLSGSSLVVNYTNSGTVTATVVGGSRYFLLDGSGPLGWGFLSNDIAPVGALAPGQTGTCADANFTFAGQASKLHAFINYQQP